MGSLLFFLIFTLVFLVEVLFNSNRISFEKMSETAKRSMFFDAI